MSQHIQTVDELTNLGFSNTYNTLYGEPNKWSRELTIEHPRDDAYTYIVVHFDTCRITIETSYENGDMKETTFLPWGMNMGAFLRSVGEL